MFEIIDDSGGTLLNENTSQYSFLTKHKFQKVDPLDLRMRRVSSMNTG